MVSSVSGTPRSVDKTGSARKAKAGGRRHLTIAGYEGEMRSPLREKQNLIASVQRSKSAQTPSRQKHMENRQMCGGQKQLRGSPYSSSQKHAAVAAAAENSQLRAASPFLHSGGKRSTPQSQQKKAMLRNNDENLPMSSSSSTKKQNRRHLNERKLTPKELPMTSLSLASPSVSSSARKSPRLNALASSGF